MYSKEWAWSSWCPQHFLSFLCLYILSSSLFSLKPKYSYFTTWLYTFFFFLWNNYIHYYMQTLNRWKYSVIICQKKVCNSWGNILNLSVADGTINVNIFLNLSLMQDRMVWKIIENRRSPKLQHLEYAWNLGFTT